MTFVPSHYQQAVFDFIQNGTGNAIVEAVAGSGKSKTIEEAYKLVRGQAIFLAFNKAIAEELKKRGLNARTFHSLTYSPVCKARGARSVEDNKLHEILKSRCSGDDFTLYASFAKRLVGLARGVGIGCLVPDTEMAWIELAEHHDIEPESEEADFGRGIEIARKLLDASNRSSKVDFDDMLYLAVKDGIALPKFDVVFVDEAQDTNPIQRALIRKLMKPTTRLIAVGDPAQAIYGFRGADANALRDLATEFNAITLPLSITYRCPTTVVNYAKQWVDHIEARDGAPEGEVKHFGTEWAISDFKADDLVVCRKTGPLIQLAYQFIRERKAVTVLGRDIGVGLKSLINRMACSSIEALTDKLVAFETREVEKATAKGDEAKAESVTDKVSAILFLIDGLEENRRTVEDLCAVIDSLFQSKQGAVLLCTIHKSKGLEASRVWWLNRSECPAQWARKEWQQEQEINLCYVATTRAKEALFTFELKDAE